MDRHGRKEAVSRHHSAEVALPVLTPWSVQTGRSPCSGAAAGEAADTTRSVMAAIPAAPPGAFLQNAGRLSYRSMCSVAHVKPGRTAAAVLPARP